MPLPTAPLDERRRSVVEARRDRRARRRRQRPIPIKARRREVAAARRVEQLEHRARVVDRRQRAAGVRRAIDDLADRRGQQRAPRLRPRLRAFSARHEHDARRPRSATAFKLFADRAGRRGRRDLVEHDERASVEIARRELADRTSRRRGSSAGRRSTARGSGTGSGSAAASPARRSSTGTASSGAIVKLLHVVERQRIRRDAAPTPSSAPFGTGIDVNATWSAPLAGTLTCCVCTVAAADRERRGDRSRGLAGVDEPRRRRSRGRARRCCRGRSPAA